MSVTFKNEAEIRAKHGDVDISAIIFKGQLAIYNAWKEDIKNRKVEKKEVKELTSEEKIKIAQELYYTAMEPSIDSYNKAQKKLDLINEKYGLKKQSLKDFFEENNINNITMNEESKESKLVA